jgi:hypothetical protein
MLDDFAKRITELREFDFTEELRRIVEQNTLVIRRYIQEQLAAGKDGDGNPSQIFDRTEYREVTIEIKHAEGVGLGAVTDRVTNYMTGDFYASLKIDVDGDIFDADSDVPYFGEIRLYSSDSFLKVNEENRKDFAEKYTLPEIAASLKSRTGLIIIQNAA